MRSLGLLALGLILGVSLGANQPRSPSAGAGAALATVLLLLLVFFHARRLGRAQGYHVGHDDASNGRP